MKNVVKWFSIITGSIIALLIILYMGIVITSNSHLNTTYTFNIEDVNIPSDIDAIARGEHIAIVRGCTDCHGPDLSGKIFIDEPPIGTLYATNITSGKGGLENYSNKDWIRAIRHGVGVDGKPLIFMPSQEFYYLNDNDLGNLIAYLKNVDKVDKSFPGQKIGPLGRTLYLAGQFPLLPAELIDHEAARPISSDPGVTVGYGEYMAIGCIGCHGGDFKGGKITGVPPEWPPAADLTNTGNLSNWTKNDFLIAMRTGNKPNGERFSEYMPYQGIGHATDMELEAMWLYLKTLSVDN